MAAGFPDIQNVRSARELVITYFEALATTRPHETDYTIGTTAVALGTNFGQRLAYICSNTGTVNIAVGFSSGITITTGILLFQGATFNSNWIFDLELVGRQLYGIAASSGATLHMIENLIAGA
jgi:hypothetical protein